MSSNLEKRARIFAIRWHDSIGQKRKYTGEPYWHHPEAVAAIVYRVPHTPEMICAAYLHDIVEDTPCTLVQIELEFGRTIATYVDWLTDIQSQTDVSRNRAARKALDRRRLAQAPNEVKTVKLADLIDNSRSIIPRDPSFAPTYLREKRLLLDESLIGGDQGLWANADAIVRAHL